MTSQGYVIVTYYKTQRILVSIDEMMINLDEERDDGYEMNVNEEKCLSFLDKVKEVGA